MRVAGEVLMKIYVLSLQTPKHPTSNIQHRITRKTVEEKQVKIATSYYPKGR
jgi:hypothetical protein